MVNKLIIALDYHDEADAWSLISRLSPHQCALKVGSEMFTTFGPSFVAKLIDKQFNVFLDLKFHDIPNTVAKACQAAASLGVWMVNVHALGGLNMMRAAREALDKYTYRPLLIAVTVLTSTSQQTLPQIGITAPLAQQVLSLSLLAHSAGLDGVVCSAHEVGIIKNSLDSNFKIITPGIRLLSDLAHDQSRIVTPDEAVRLGSDYIVMGRSITQSLDPEATINNILTLIGQ